MNAMTTDTLVVIKEFQHELDSQKTWRVDWLGSVSRRRETVFQHQVEVFLSPLQGAYKGPVTDPDAATLFQQRSVFIGVGYLPILYIGATFRDGKPVGQRPERFRRINIEQALDPSTSRYLSFDSQISRGGMQAPLPPAVYPSEFNLGRLAWPLMRNSRMLALGDVNLVDPYYVLIPCIEVIRFFFCTSSLLATHLFSNAWSSLLWEAGSSTENLPQDVTVGTHTVKGLQAVDGRHLAFMLTSEKTLRAVRMVHQALQMTSSAAATAIDLECPFPFDEHTHIEAEVVEIATKTPLKKRYLVTRLHRCERPIPFSICYVNPILNPAQGENHDSPDLIPMSIGSSRRDERAENDLVGRIPVATNTAEIRELGLTGDDQGRPGAFDEQIFIRVHEDRFPGLRDVPTVRAPKELQRYRNVPSGARALLLRAGQGSTAEPGTGGNPVISSQLRTEENDFENYERSQPNVQLLLDSAPVLYERGFQARVLPLQRLIPRRDLRDGSRSWALVRNARSLGGQCRSRLLACLSVEIDDQRIVVADIERRYRSGPQESFALAGFLLRPGCSKEEFLYELTDAVSRRRGWPSTMSQVETDREAANAWIFMRKTNHFRDVSAEALAHRIYASLIAPLLENAR
jgi:hypothetical protein